jgi:hypothetical protein
MRFNVLARASAIAALLTATRIGPLVAQVAPDTTNPRPYSQLRLRVAGARNVNREPLHDFWRAGTGAAVSLTTPFYVGSVGAGGTFIPFRTRDGARPNFRALLLALDWGLELPAPRPLYARAAARIGDFVMLIDNPDVWLDSESELFVGGELSAGLQLRRDLAFAVAGSFARVHTRPSLDLAFVTVGIEYVTRTPGWLRTILE